MGHGLELRAEVEEVPLRGSLAGGLDGPSVARVQPGLEVNPARLLEGGHGWQIVEVVVQVTRQEAGATGLGQETRAGILKEQVVQACGQRCV